MRDHTMQRHTYLSMQAFPVMKYDISYPGIVLDRV